MKYVLHIFICIVQCIDLLAQSRKHLIIANETSRQPLAYATIKYTNKNIGFYTSESGEIDLALVHDDTLIITYVGFIQKKVFGDLLKIDTIFLKPVSNILTELIIKPHKPIDKPLEVGYMNEKTDFKSRSMIAVEFAVQVPLPEKYQLYKISQIIISLQKTSIVNPVRIHIYEPASNMEPGDEILKEDIIIKKVNGTNRFEIDVSLQNIVTSSKIIFIGLEWIENTYYRNKISGPYTRFTTSLNEARTYTRTINDISHKWVKFNPNSASTLPPPNLIAGLKIQPLEN